MENVRQLKDRETIVKAWRKRPTHQYALHRRQYRQANREGVTLWRQETPWWEM